MLFGFLFHRYQSFSERAIELSKGAISYNSSLRGLNCRENHARLVAAWGYQASSARTDLNWFHEYKHGKLDVSDSVRSGRRHTAVTDEMIDAI